MAASKTYLNVPYAQKDAAKALGARWDPGKKQWYVPANVDIAPFAKWQPAPGGADATANADGRPKAQAPRPKNSSANHDTTAGVVTYPTIANFVAYDGDEPPWE